MAFDKKPTETQNSLTITPLVIIPLWTILSNEFNPPTLLHWHRIIQLNDNWRQLKELIYVLDGREASLLRILN